jgi:O-acetyl-ADP-ribose deacetylase (regulator of RNase III)
MEAIDNTGGAYLFSHSEIIRPGAPPLRIECYAGDILAKHSDALIVSAFERDYLPVPNSILGAIRRRFGFAFGVDLPAGTVSVHPGLHRFPTPPCDAFSSLWVIEVCTPGQREDSDLSARMAVLRSHVTDIVNSGAQTIALPLIGTGYQGLDIKDVTFEILKLVRYWAVTEPRLRVVRLFAYDFEKIATLNRIIGEFFDVPREASASALLAAATAELKQKLSTFNYDQVRDGLLEIWQLASAPNAHAGSIATRGRVFAESCCKILFTLFLPQQECPEALGGMLHGLQPFLKARQNWILAYLRLLQFCGNTGAHDTGARVTLTDAAAVVVSVIRVAEFTSQELAAAPNRG